MNYYLARFVARRRELIGTNTFTECYARIAQRRLSGFTQNKKLLMLGTHEQSGRAMWYLTIFTMAVSVAKKLEIYGCLAAVMRLLTIHVTRQVFAVNVERR